MEERQPLPWEEPGWFDRVETWVRVELRRLGLQADGKLELVRARPWAAVARVSTAAGAVWFKEPAPSLAFEPTLTVAVAKRCPGFAPDVLAADGSWLLTRDAGSQLRGVLKGDGPAPSWDELLPLYAQLQIDLIDDVANLIAHGAPDKRPAMLRDAYPILAEHVGGLGTVDLERRRAVMPKLEAVIQALGDAVPATVIHEEFHEANVFVLGGRPRLLDWGDAAVSHPFAVLINTLRDIAFRRRLKPNGREMIRLRSVYLEPWTVFASPSELNQLFDHGYVLGALCRALTWDRVLAGQSASVRAEYGRNAAVWLDMIFREAIEEGVRLGA